MHGKNNTYNFKRKAAPYVFIAPFYLLFAVFMLYPIIFSFRASFTSWNGVSEMKWVGLQNYARLFKDDIFLQALLNCGIIFLMFIPLLMILSLAIASLLNSPSVKYRNFFRATIYIPNITSIIAVAFVFGLAFDTKYGIINDILTSIGLPAVSWLGTIWGARVAIVTLMLWRWLGYIMIIVLAGLQTIPYELVEAARIDGAGKLLIFIKIKIPMLKPVLLFCTILATIGTFALFTEPMILTNGGPLYKTMTPVLYIYNQSFLYFKMGYASSLAYVFFIVMIVLALIQLKLSRMSD